MFSSIMKELEKQYSEHVTAEGIANAIVSETIAVIVMHLLCFIAPWVTKTLSYKWALVVVLYEMMFITFGIYFMNQKKSL